MINFQMAITAEHQAVVTAEFICIDDAATPNGFNGQPDERSVIYENNSCYH